MSNDKKLEEAKIFKRYLALAKINFDELIANDDENNEPAWDCKVLISNAIQHYQIARAYDGYQRELAKSDDNPCVNMPRYQTNHRGKPQKTKPTPKGTKVLRTEDRSRIESERIIEVINKKLCKDYDPLENFSLLIEYNLTNSVLLCDVREFNECIENVRNNLEPKESFYPFYQIILLPSSRSFYKQYTVLKK